MKATHWIGMLAVGLLAAGGGWFARERLALTAPSTAPEDAPSAATGPCRAGAEPLYWRAPMVPTFVRPKPGKSPMGMDLVPVCPGEAGTAEGVVAIDPAVVQSIGVRTALVVRRDLGRKIRTVGRVVVDERRVAHVHTKVQGWVEKLSVQYEGEAVKAGAPLLEIYSPELVSTQEELLVAARYREQTAPSSIEDVREGGEALFEATRRRLELWDIPERDIERLLETGEIRKTLTLYAPTSGVVTEFRVREGMEVRSNDNLYTIADLSRVWVFADIYEYELPWIAKGQRAVVEMSYMPARKFEGSIVYVYPVLDPRTHTARVRIELANPDSILKPAMYADVTIETQVRPDVIVVPEEAVIRSGTRALVIVALGSGRFQPRDVVMGIDSGDGWIEIRSGVREGERIVTSGQFLIDSESRLQSVVQKLLQGSQSGKMAVPSNGDTSSIEHDTPMEHHGHEVPHASPPGGGPTQPHDTMRPDGEEMPAPRGTEDR